MCAIVGSSDKHVLKELFKLNAYRGEMSYSIACINDHKVHSIHKAAGKMPGNFIDDLPSAAMYIGHTQAPTTQSSGIHPAILDQRMLWHNGIIKQRAIPAGTWDTHWLLQQLIIDGYHALSLIDGTFACAYWDSGLYLFRNEISPMFVDDDLNISSTQFEGSRALEPNTVFNVSINNKQLIACDKFKTKENPFYFGDNE